MQSNSYNVLSHEEMGDSTLLLGGETELENSAREFMPREAPTGQKFECRDCGLIFLTDNEQAIHYRFNTEHAFNVIKRASVQTPGWREFNAMYCGRCNLPIVDDLWEHYETNDQHNVCWICKADFYAAEDFIEHRRASLPGFDQHKETFKIWKATMHDQEYCDWCFMGFSSIDARKHHERTDLIHCDQEISNLTPDLLDKIRCSRCDIDIIINSDIQSTPEAWETHKTISTNHNVCSICSLDFCSAEDLIYHIRKNIKDEKHKLYRCPKRTCLGAFTSFGELRDHCNSMAVYDHTGDHMFWGCSHCEMTFINFQSWYDHEESIAWALIREYDLVELSDTF